MLKELVNKQLYYVTTKDNTFHRVLMLYTDVNTDTDDMNGYSREFSHPMFSCSLTAECIDLEQTTLFDSMFNECHLYSLANVDAVCMCTGVAIHDGQLTFEFVNRKDFSKFYLPLNSPLPSYREEFPVAPNVGDVYQLSKYTHMMSKHVALPHHPRSGDIVAVAGTVGDLVVCFAKTVAFAIPLNLFAFFTSFEDEKQSTLCILEAGKSYDLKLHHASRKYATFIDYVISEHSPTTVVAKFQNSPQSAPFSVGLARLNPSSIVPSGYKVVTKPSHNLCPKCRIVRKGSGIKFCSMCGTALLGGNADE